MTVLIEYNDENPVDDSQLVTSVTCRTTREIFPIPKSHFFTELPLPQQLAENSFGPIGSSAAERERKFRITSKFIINEARNAYATVTGLIFIAPYGNSTQKVNVFLKPSTGAVCDIGIKIKYFVYRGISKECLFSEILPESTEIIKPSNPNATRFIQKVWDEFLEFNFPENQNANDITFLAKKLGFSVIINPNDNLDYQFKRSPNASDPSNALGLINRGQKIGQFVNDVRFEVVLDYGDSEREQTETGFALDLAYARATECVFDLEGTPPVPDPEENPELQEVTVGFKPSDSVVSRKLFRENVFHFMDPAAFYGAHINESDMGLERRGEVFYGNSVENGQTSHNSYLNKSDIVQNILVPFINSGKIFLYILGVRGRSYNFFNTSGAAPLSINGQNVPMGTNSWPIIILDTGNVVHTPAEAEILLRFNNLDSLNNDLLYSKDPYQRIQFNGFKERPKKVNPQFKILKPNYENVLIANFIYVNFERDTTPLSPLDNFGPANLEPIFEYLDSSLDDRYYQWLSYLKPKLMVVNDEAFIFETKAVFEGFQDIIVNGSPSRRYRKRLFIYYPKDKTQERSSTTLSPVDVSGYDKILKQQKNKVRAQADAVNFGKLILNNSDIYIWKGIANDGTADKPVLSLRNVKDDDVPKFYYLVGLTYNDNVALQENLPANSYNPYFYMEEVVLTGADSDIKKYKLGLRYEDTSGTIHSHFGPTSVYVYTIDGRFYSTPGYADSLNENNNQIANISVEFLLKEDFSGEFGFDYMRKVQVGLYPPFKEIVGKDADQLDGNNDFATGFAFDREMYNNLKINEYNAVPIPWHLTAPGADSDSQYYTPWLSANKDVPVALKLKIKVNAKPKSLFINFNSDVFDISTTPANASQIINNPDKSLPELNKRLIFTTNFTANTVIDTLLFNITCKQSLREDTALDVIASSYESQIEVERLAGRLKISRNELIHQKVLFVPTIIKLPGETVEKKFAISQLKQQKEALEKFLKQSCIVPEVDFYKINPSLPINLNSEDNSNIYHLDLRTDKHFSQPFHNSEIPGEQRGYYIYNSGTGNIIRGGYEDPTATLTPEEWEVNLPCDFEHIKVYLNHKLADLGLLRPRGTMIVFFINNEGGLQPLPLIDPYDPNSSPFGNLLGGFSDGLRTDVMIFQINPVTIAHEVYHSLGLPHTFNKLSLNSKYVFKARETDNLMDYSHRAIPPKPRILTYRWQWLLARENSRSYEII